MHLLCTNVFEGLVATSTVVKIINISEQKLSPGKPGGGGFELILLSADESWDSPISLE